MNRREIRSDIKKEIVRIKLGWKHYQTVDPRKRKSLVARGLFGIRLLILHFSIFQIHQIFNISYFPQFNLSFEKKYLPQNAQKSPQNLHKTAKQWLMR